MESESEEELLLASAAACIIIKKKKPRKKWSKQWLLHRYQYTHTNLLKELALEPVDWRNYLRMDEQNYFKLLELVTPKIQKQSTTMGESISAHERLCATICFLASGLGYERLKFSTIISPQRLGVIIPETCRAIISALQKYMKMPESEDEWRIIGKEFEERWQFPNCLGAVDGKHVRITPPHGSGSYYYNYKHFHSVVLMACANANYEFIWCEVGTNGRVSDGGVIKNTDFYEQLCSNNFKIPPKLKSKNSLVEMPFVFVGDEAFSLRADFLKPYGSKNSITQEKKIFNYRLSRARRIIENVFGIMSSRFRIFHTAINLSVERIDLVILACCILHNFLRKNVAQYSTADFDFDIETNTNDDTIPTTHLTPLHIISQNASNSAKAVRDLYSAYFNYEGSVPWQNDMVR